MVKSRLRVAGLRTSFSGRIQHKG